MSRTCYISVADILPVETENADCGLAVTENFYHLTRQSGKVLEYVFQRHEDSNQFPKQNRASPSHWSFQSY